MKRLIDILKFSPIAVLIAAMLVYYPAYSAGQKAVEAAVAQSAAASDSSGDDSIFTEIHVTPEGAYAVDSNGKEWEYDFSRDEFIESDESESSTKTTFRRRDKSSGSSTDLSNPDLIIQPDEGLYITPRKVAGLKLGSVEVDENEVVDGSIVAVGPVTVKGLVRGDVTSYKKVTVTSTGRIMGDVRAPTIEKMRGGYIGGRRDETAMPNIPEIGIVREYTYAALNAIIIILICLLVAALLTASIARRPIERVKTCLQVSFIKSFFVGFLIWIGYGPFFGLLCLTIIGIPVAVLALPLITIAAIILAIVGLSQFTGEIFSRLFGGAFSSRLGQIFLGILVLLSGWVLFALLYASSSDVAQGFATALLVISIVIWSIGLTAAVGAIMLTRFGSRDCRKVVIDEVRREYMQPPPPPTPPPLSG
jgi:hypothetical protein